MDNACNNSQIKRRRLRPLAISGIATAALLLALTAHFIHGEAATAGIEKRPSDANSSASIDSLQSFESRPTKGHSATQGGSINSPLLPGDKYSIRQLSSDFFRLATLANTGDIVAAKTLWRALEDCSLAPKNRTELDAKVRTIQSDSYPLPMNFAGGRLALIESLSSSYARCGEISSAQLDTRRKWISQLAAAGDTDARLEFPFAAQPNDIELSDFDERRSAFVENAKTYLRAEIASGNTSALSVMAHSYMPSIIAGQSTPFVVDGEQAYMYFYAYALSGDAPTGTMTTLAQLENSMSVEQVQLAREGGRRIFDECCHQ